MVHDVEENFGQVQRGPNDGADLHHGAQLVAVEGPIDLEGFHLFPKGFVDLFLAGALTIGALSAYSFSLPLYLLPISVFGFSLWPHYFMKIYTARDVRTLKKTVVWYPTFMIFLVPILFIGFSGILRFPGVEPTDAILPTIVTSLGLPAIVVGLFCAGALAASMSTGDALVHAAGSILVNDLYKVYFNPDISDVAERRMIRFLVVVIAGIAYYFAVFSDYSLVGLLLYSYGFLSQFFPLLLAAFFWPRATRPGVIAGLLAGQVDRCAATQADAALLL